MRSTPLLALLIACVWAITALGSETPDLRVQLNPALARLYERDPQAAREALRAFEAIIEGRAEGSASDTRKVPSPRIDELIDENPLFEEAYRIDPKAALQQLQEIVGSGGTVR